MKRRTVQLVLATILCSSAAMGQINCLSGPAANKLVCEWPLSTQVFRNNGALGLGSNQQLSGNTALKAAEAINVGIASQVSQLPLATASAGAVVVYHAGVPETFNNLGPILIDRAQTVGRHRLFIGFTASQFVFTDVDGFPLKKLPFAFESTAYQPGTTTVVSNTYTTEQANARFKINQFLAVGTFGLTNRVDMSVIVPVEYVSLGATAQNSISYTVNSNNQVVEGPYSNPSAYSAGTASGVGDVTVNGKGVLWSGERASVAAGLNVRIPTGDDLNLLGSGAWGFTPSIVYSYLGRVSPHAKFGYEWNTTSELNNPTLTAGGNKQLPGGMQYDIGADWAMNKKVTIATDLLGSQFLNTPELLVGTVSVSCSSTVQGTCPQNNEIPASNTGIASYTINNASVGLKWNPARNLVLSANGLFQINNTGLRSRPTPLIGISYKF
ncbi:MAG TPA: transporter [Terracidiphilus sp.]|nr:transporter [Terracidiphilus sp.]